MRTLLRWLSTALAIAAIVVFSGVFSPTQALAAASLPGQAASGPIEAGCMTNYYGQCMTNYGYGNSYYGNSNYSNPYYNNSYYGNYNNSYYSSYCCSYRSRNYRNRSCRIGCRSRSYRSRNCRSRNWSCTDHRSWWHTRPLSAQRPPVLAVKQPPGLESGRKRR